MEVAQLLNTPDEYLLQLVASTVTEIGLAESEFSIPVHPEADTTEEILNEPPFFLQAWLTPAQGYSDSLAIPLALTQLRACDGHPPLQPWFPNEPEQSTSCCSERLTVCPLILAHDSATPVAENAQHDPHWPWFLTGETPPLVVQSMSALAPDIASSTASLTSGLGSRQVLKNSASVMAVNWLMPILQVWVESALCLLMASTFLWKMILLYSSSP